MKTYNYDNLSCARVIRDNPHLYNEDFHKWAREVIQYFNDLFDLARLYNKTVKDWQLSIAMVWHEIKTTSKHAIRNLLKAARLKLVRVKQGVRQFRADTGEYVRTGYPEKCYQTTKAGKHRLRMKNYLITQRLQTI